ncbi:hypothetical protein P691DRAFT_790466 [Macrolepiota fuliginosa MF-IS2]|uniref:Uncharacterized protein n=1 Tax=Macrolepiota fuliginosa MF-IS2 TaxID=1400762 RepID=A0A9P5XHS8_9AGAR|nr:hypothetical protein P691DRAFT_790466 [Macrolepiota fuliginosa MF-IS2]
MTAFTPQYIDLTSKAPLAPRARPIPLPALDAPKVAIRETSNTDGQEIYPINTHSTLTPNQQLDLWEIELTAPIHVHTPEAHIGTITAAFPSQSLTALDAFLVLQSITLNPLDFHMTFSYLSSDMKERVKTAFYQRNFVTMKTRRTAWERFASGSGCVSDEGPLGIDLLLGNAEVWGFETWSLAGYGVVHLAGSLAYQII